ncbi:MAG: biotin--[Oscillospiraceae bacterium]|nr:biotin--[acetyl-CoA-carboxylase] ligase [Oscillospiraceae bacterium]
MGLKDLVLGELKKYPSEYISGGELASRLNLSRTAVWKAVESLRADGWDISAVTNRGYRLLGGSPFTSEALSLLLPHDVFDIAFYEKISSTNDILKAEAALGGREWKVAIAEQQEAGKGRMGRSFFSPPGCGLYMSILLRPNLLARDSLLLTTAAAVAVAVSAEKLSGEKAEIKWVNDVLMDGKKICGILTEGALDLESGGLQYAVVGIGVNAVEPEGGFDPSIAGIAGSVFPSGYRLDRRAELAAEILNLFRSFYLALPERPFLEEYRRRSSVIGKEITVYPHIGGEGVDAVALGVTDDFELLVRFPDGREAALSSGEVSVRPRRSSSLD